jgi:hypothetical protein
VDVERQVIVWVDQYHNISTYNINSNSKSKLKVEEKGNDVLALTDLVCLFPLLIALSVAF